MDWTENPRVNALGAPLCTSRRRGSKDLCGATALKGYDKCQFHVGMSIEEARLKHIGVAANAAPALTRRLAGAGLGRVSMTSEEIKAAKVVVDILDARAVGRIDQIDRAQADRIAAALEAATADLDDETRERVEGTFFRVWQQMEDEANEA